MRKIPIIVIVGPTATGKTSLSVRLAERLSGEIVSGDSMQIYKGMHIASAAPEETEKLGIPHHMFEFLDRAEEYSVAEYVADAKQAAFEIFKRGRVPVIVGGTGLYISSLINNIRFTEEPADESLRRSLLEKYDSIGAEAMLRELGEFDPEAARSIHPNNKKRIIRAFEIYKTTGKTITEQNAESRQEPSPFFPFIIGLCAEDRQFVYERINTRVDIMLEQGLLEEARAAYNDVGSKTSVQAIGHKEFFPYFEGKITLDEAVEMLKRETRRYAKRQLTWFGRDPRIEWINIDTTEDILSSALLILERKGYFEQKNSDN